MFKRAVTGLTRLVLEEGDDDIATKTYEGATVDDFVKGMSGTLGEKIQLGRVVRYETSDGLLDGYKHVQNERGTVGVLVELAGVDPTNAQAHEVAHDIALHIAQCCAPLRVTRRRAGRRRRRASARSSRRRPREEGKPEQALGKIVDGKLNGFFKTVALLEQPFVKDQKTTIKALVDGLGGGASVRRFARVKIGEE